MPFSHFIDLDGTNEIFLVSQEGLRDWTDMRELMIFIFRHFEALIFSKEFVNFLDIFNLWWTINLFQGLCVCVLTDIFRWVNVDPQGKSFKGFGDYYIFDVFLAGIVQLICWSD